jgi:hypothetical protein
VGDKKIIIIIFIYLGRLAGARGVRQEQNAGGFSWADQKQAEFQMTLDLQAQMNRNMILQRQQAGKLRCHSR